MNYSRIWVDECVCWVFDVCFRKLRKCELKCVNDCFYDIGFKMYCMVNMYI